MIKNSIENFGMISMIIIIPILLLSSIILQVHGITDFLKIDNVSYSCNPEYSDECAVTKIFLVLSVLLKIIGIGLGTLLLFCTLEMEFSIKRKTSKMFIGNTCKSLFMDYYNGLLIIIPLALLFQIISFITELSPGSPDSSYYSTGFYTEIISIIILVTALIFHPSVNRSDK
jgi:hypothetical protein